MLFKTRLIGIFYVGAVFIATSCKLKMYNSDLHEVKASKDNQSGVDVNDVSILFPKVGNGQFYPNIDIKTVWPQSAFDNLINFASGKKTKTKDGSGNEIEVEFGKFVLTATYAKKVNEFFKNPSKVPSGTGEALELESAAKEIADKMRPTKKCDAQGQNCSDVPAEVVCESYSSGLPLSCTDILGRPNFSSHRFAITDLANWRIVGMRMDFCAGAHKAELSEQCEVEFRLIAQPFGDAAPVPGATTLETKQGDRIFMFDVSAHLIYKIGRYNMLTGEIVGPNNVPTQFTAKQIVDSLLKIKSAAQTSVNISTNGLPLGVHPGLKAEAAKFAKQQPGELAKAVINAINTYAESGRRLTNVTSMHVAGPALFDSSDWVFFQGIIEGGAWLPSPITGSSDIWSVRTHSTQGTSGKMFPPPQLQPGRQTINAIFSLPATAELPPAIADLPMLFDNPGRFGDPSLSVVHRINGNGVLVTPIAPSVKNTDCISCHMTSTRAFEWGVHSIDPITGSARPTLYTPPVGATAYLDPEVIPRIDYQLRNFGYFLPPPFANPLPPAAKPGEKEPGLGAVFNFIGPRQEVPSIMNRVANESAELVNLINTRILGVSNPGFTCEGEDADSALAISKASQADGTDLFSPVLQNQIRRNATTHARINDCLLFESYRPGTTFATCAQRCSAGASDSKFALLKAGTYKGYASISHTYEVIKNVNTRQIVIVNEYSRTVFTCPSIDNTCTSTKPGQAIEIMDAEHLQFFKVIHGHELPVMMTLQK